MHFVIIVPPLTLDTTISFYCSFHQVPAISVFLCMSHVQCLNKLSGPLPLVHPYLPSTGHRLQMSLSSADQKGRITSLGLQVVLFLLQVRIPLSFFTARVNCLQCSISCPLGYRGPLLTRCFSLNPSLYWCVRLFLLSYRTRHFLLLSFTGFLSVCLCRLLLSL